VSYFLPKAQTAIQVVQAVACDSAPTNVYSLSAATPANTYMADTAHPQSFLLSGLNHFYADADTSFTLTPDGRLLTVNSTQTGAGEAFVKAGVGALVAVATGGAVPAAHPVPGAAPKTPLQQACDKISAASKDKPLVLTYNLENPITYTSEFATEIPLKPDPPSEALANDLAAFLPALTVRVGAKPAAANGARYDVGKAASEDAALLTLPDTGPVRLTVLATPRDGKPAKTVLSTVVVAPLGTTYQLPIPRGALFGKRSVSLALTDSGALTTVGYAAGSGAADAATSVSDVLAPFAAKTTAQKAADLKDQADLIAQQQRLLKCETDPTNCPS
jgi:hypothetical protein